MTFDQFATQVCQVSAEMNPHLTNYESIEAYVKFCDAEDEWVSSDEQLRACTTNRLCALYVYPTTPIGSFRYLASTFEAAFAAAVDTLNDPR